LVGELAADWSALKNRRYKCKRLHQDRTVEMTAQRVHEQHGLHVAQLFAHLHSSSMNAEPPC